MLSDKYKRANNVFEKYAYLTPIIVTYIFIYLLCLTYEQLKILIINESTHSSHWIWFLSLSVLQ